MNIADELTPGNGEETSERRSEEAKERISASSRHDAFASSLLHFFASSLLRVCSAKVSRPPADKSVRPTSALAPSPFPGVAASIFSVCARVTFALLCAFSLAMLSGCCRERRDYVVTDLDAQSSAAPATSGNLERIKSAGVLRIAVKRDTPPFAFEDEEGRPQGFEVDLGFRIARALEVQPRFVPVTSAERIEKLKSGEVDIILATLTATRRRAKDVDFSLPYFQDQQSLLVRSDSAIQSYRDLSGKKVAAAAGSTSIENIRIVAPGAEIVSVATPAQGLELLKKGEVDALTGDGLQLVALRVKSGQPEQLRVAGEGFSVEPYVIGLPQNDSALRARIDEALSDLWNSGAWTRLFHKWLGEQSPYNLEARFQMPVLPP